MHLKIILLLVFLLPASFGQERTFMDIAKPDGTIPEKGSRRAAFWGMLRIKMRIDDRMVAVRSWSEQQLMAAAANSEEDEHTRMACAILLLRDHESPEARKAALSAFGLRNNILKDEGEMTDWTASYPVAGAAAATAAGRPELLKTIANGGITGELPYIPVKYLLRTLWEQGRDNTPLVERILKDTASAEARRRGESLLAASKGEYLDYTPPPLSESPAPSSIDPPLSRESAPEPPPAKPVRLWPWIAGGAALLLVLLLTAAAAVRRARRDRT